MFFLQMSGFPGSGKSTLAREIASQTGAVLVNHHLSKTALLEEIPDIDTKQAGKASYKMDWAMIEANLSIGNSAILDSPCLYQPIIEKGEQLAEQYNVKYKYVECYLDDFQKINHRLKQRESLPSQIKEVSSEVIFQSRLRNSKKPMNHPILVIDTKNRLDTYIQKVMDYIKA